MVLRFKEIYQAIFKLFYIFKVKNISSVSIYFKQLTVYVLGSIFSIHDETKSYMYKLQRATQGYKELYVELQRATQDYNKEIYVDYNGLLRTTEGLSQNNRGLN